MAQIKFILISAVRVIFGTLLFFAILFIPAGRLNWKEGWLFVAAFWGFLLFIFTWGLIKDPALLKERSRMGKNVKSWDKIIIRIYSFLVIVLFCIAGLDSGRFYWSSVPVFMQIVGWIGLIVAGTLVWRTMVTNTYLSSMVRIQNDRGHKVITTGPYQFVRHPMYVGVIVCIMCIPWILNSWWAFIPGMMITLLFLIRTSLEDKTLHQELDGYKEYAQKVKYRLFPGIW